ncbi:MAG: hypothetical protein LBJ31_02955 [Treponema sp.]|jgi:predicted LPLAT superfamily acyltransferase|nr:hypothetical protein [Treponema sp.]
MNDQHWTGQNEVAGYRQLKLLLFLFKLLPPLLLRLLAFPVGFCFFLAAKNVREQSRRYLAHAAAAGAIKRFNALQSLKQVIAFAITITEKVQAWGGKIDFTHIHFQNDDIPQLIDRLEKKEGAVLLTSHLGNSELLRALADYSRTGVSRDIPVISVLDSKITPHYARMLAELNPRSRLRIIDSAGINAGVVTMLLRHIVDGGLVVIAADRTPKPDGQKHAHKRHEPFMISFLGSPAPFPQGPFILASLLEAPVYAVFALRRGALSISSEYNMHVHRLRKESPGVSRAWINDAARRFASLLETYCLRNPHQWYNFYDFWRPYGSPSTDS